MIFNDIFGSGKLLADVIGGGAFSQNGVNPLANPSLDLNFAGTQTFAASKGPTPVFTRASSGSFVGSNGLIQTASTNVARITYDPATLACRGYLHESARTNEITHSEDLSNAAWTNAGTTETLSGITAPDGTTNTVYKIEETATTGRHGTFDTLTVASGTYTHSVFMKQGDRQYGVLHWDITAATDFAIIVVDLSNGTITQQSTVGTAVTTVSSGVQAYPNGWYRVWITATSTVHAYFTVSMSDTSTFSAGTDFGYKTYTGTAGLGIYVWGAQSEVGDALTSYIKTTGSTATRAQDVCSITSTDFSGIFNANEGTILVDYARSERNNSNGRLVYFNNSGTSNTIHIIDSSGSGDFANVVAATVETVNIGYSTTQFTPFKLALAYKENDSATAKNGASLQTDVSCAMPTGINRLDIGNNFAANGSYEGTIARIRYYPTRLSNPLLLQGTT